MLSGGRCARSEHPLASERAGRQQLRQRQVGAAASRPVGLCQSTSGLHRMEDSRETSPSSNNSSEELSSALQLSKGMSIFLDVSIDEAVRWAPWTSPLGEREGRAQPLAAGVVRSDLHPNYLLSVVPPGDPRLMSEKRLPPNLQKELSQACGFDYKPSGDRKVQCPSSLGFCQGWRGNRNLHWSV